MAIDIHANLMPDNGLVQVFEGVDTNNEETIIIKVLKPIAKKKIRREIKILRNLSGGPNVVGLLDVVHDPPSRSHSLIMEYVHNTDWKTLCPTFTDFEIKNYIFQLRDVSGVLSLWRNQVADDTARH